MTYKNPFIFILSIIFLVTSCSENFGIFMNKNIDANI